MEAAENLCLRTMLNSTDIFRLLVCLFESSKEPVTGLDQHKGYS